MLVISNNAFTSTKEGFQHPKPLPWVRPCPQRSYLLVIEAVTFLHPESNLASPRFELKLNLEILMHE